jgi:DNA-binding transcriptional MerR regulator
MDAEDRIRRLSAAGFTAEEIAGIAAKLQSMSDEELHYASRVRNLTDEKQSVLRDIIREVTGHGVD